MEQNRYTKIISETLTGVIEGILSAREDAVESGALIAPGRKQVEVEFHMNLYHMDSYVNFKIPVALPVFPATAGTDRKPDIPVTPGTKINETGLSARVKHGLYRENIETVRGLLAVPEPGKLLRIRGIGNAGQQEIESFLSRHGFSLGQGNRKTKN